jgi:hypothetical protein
MPVGIGSTQITGISVVANPADAANKQYVDSSSGGLPSIDGNENEFLFTDGSTVSWQPIQGYQEYTTAGNYVFDIPTQAKELFIEATGAGGGGAPGSATTSTTYTSRGEFWFLRTSGTTSNFTGNGNVGNPLGSYGLGFYVMGTGSGTIFASTDSITWVARTSGFGTSVIWTVNYGSNIFISTCAITGTGPLRTSTDTIHWILRTSGSVSQIITTISTDNNFHLYADQNGQIRSSTDGITWNIRTTPTRATFSLYARAYSASPSTNYVFAGSTGIVASTDGIVWQLRTSGLGSVTFYRGTYGNGIYLFGTSGGTLIASTDTIVWTSRNYPSGSSNQISDVIFGNNTYIVNQYNNRYLITSTDSIVWIVRTSPAVSVHYCAGIFGNSIFVYGSETGRIIASDIPSGNAGSGGGGGASIGSIISRSNISGSTLNVNVGSGGTSGTAGAASTVSWTSPGGNFSITANGGSAGVNTFLSTSNIVPGGAGGTVTVSNNYVYSSAGTAGGNGGYFESSTNNMQGLAGSDATSTTLVYQTTGGGGGASSLFDGQFGTFGGTINYYGNTYQNSKTISALMNGTSSLPISGLSYGNGGNGGGAQHGAVAWVLRTSGFGATAYEIGYGNGIYILCGNGGRLSTSTDTITWIARTSGFGTSNINATLYANNNYLIFGSGGAISISTDSIGWTARTTAGAATGILGNPNNGGPSAIYANDLYFICGSSMILLISTDSIVWTQRTTNMSTLDVRSIAYGSDKTEKYVISGSSSNIRSSTDTIVWTLRTLGQSATTVGSLQYFNQNYYAFTQGGLFVTSTDAIVWTLLRNSGVQYTSAISSNSLIVGGSLGWITTSTNGISWVLRTSGVSTNAFSCAYGNGLFLATYGAGAQVIVADSNINGGNGGAGTKGGGGGGGGYNLATNTVGTGGTGGDGYVRISWQ